MLVGGGPPRKYAAISCCSRADMPPGPGGWMWKSIVLFIARSSRANERANYRELLPPRALAVERRTVRQRFKKLEDRGVDLVGLLSCEAVAQAGEHLEFGAADLLREQRRVAGVNERVVGARRY